MTEGIAHASQLLAAQLREESIFETLRPVVRCLGDLFGPDCEVILHDLRKPEASIIAIANNHVSGRRVGAPIVAGPLEDQALAWLHQPGESGQMHVYTTRTRDGRQLKSATVVYRDENGVAMAALCINYDLSRALEMEHFIHNLIGIQPSGPPPEETADEQPADIEDILSELIANCLAEFGGDPERMGKQQRFQVVQRLDERGVFLIRGAAQRVANALKVSKFTIYSYLEELRNT